MVSWIEMPNTHFGKNNIPNYKKNGCNYYRRKDCFPSIDISHSWFKTVQKRNYNRENIEIKV